ncbi:MAG: creatininase family protein [Treponema sp.]|jgi:creatinine amidohydrolase|nr:creatininase family protein [Treponema sp.]
MLTEINSLSWQDIDGMNLSESCYLLPIASLEQHGRHLPVGTDDFILRSVLDRLKEDNRITVPMLLLPAIHYGNSREHLAFPGTVSLSNATIVSIVEDVLFSMKARNIKKLILLNSHGGNTALLNAHIKEWKQKFSLSLFVINLWDSPFFDGVQPLIETPASLDIHAGEIETSILLEAMPALVHRDRISPAADCPVRLKPYGDGWFSVDLSPGNGVLGAPSKASPEKGKKLLQYCVDRIVEYFLEILSN